MVESVTVLVSIFDRTSVNKLDYRRDFLHSDLCYIFVSILSFLVFYLKFLIGILESKIFVIRCLLRISIRIEGTISLFLVDASLRCSRLRFSSGSFATRADTCCSARGFSRANASCFQASRFSSTSRRTNSATVIPSSLARFSSHLNWGSVKTNDVRMLIRTLLALPRLSVKEV